MTPDAPEPESPSPPPAPPSPRALVASAAIFYLLMVLAGAGLTLFQDRPLSSLLFGDGESVLFDTGLGAGAGLGVVLLTRLAWNWPPVRRLNAELRAVLGQQSSPTIAALAVSSAIGEEVFFRGALQPLLGFWVTAALFGLVHGGTVRRLRLWAIFATLAGLLLGWLMLLTENLLAPILCHFTVNYFNLHALTGGAPPEATT